MARAVPHLLVDTYPKLIHIAHVDAWPSLERHGLLCTSRLLDLFEVDPTRREAIERRRRPDSVTVTHPSFGMATIRDQAPLLEKRLERALQGMTLSEWYELLNAHVFLWPTTGRMLTMLGAAAYRDLPQLVVTLDTGDLMRSHEHAILLSRINSGATRPFAWERGRHTFQSLAEYPLDERIQSVGKTRAVAEVLVRSAIKPLTDVAESAVVWKGGQPAETSWRRSR